LHATDSPRGIYFLKSGHIRQYDISRKTGNELTVHIFNPGSFFPLTWGLNSIPNRYFFQAMGKVEMYVVPREDILTFLQDNPDVLLSLTQRLLSGLDGMILRLQNQVFGDSYTRTISELLYLARHFGRKEGKCIVIEQAFTHQNVADLTGAVRETVSVAMKKLQTRDLIRYDGLSIIINDTKRLEAELKNAL